MSIKAAIGSDAQTLIIGPKNEDYLSVTIKSGLNQFGITTYLFSDAPQLVQFFENLAEYWQGWGGTKSWNSVEGDFRLVAIHDGIKHVKLTVSLIKDQGEETQSNYVGNVLVELGGLAVAAAEVRKVLA